MDKRRTIPKVKMQNLNFWWMLGRQSDKKTEKAIYKAVRKAYGYDKRT